MENTLRIIVIVLTLLVALGLGLFLRRILVRRLKSTVLDNWLIQILGVVIVFPPLIVAAFAVPLIWDPGRLLFYWQSIEKSFQISNLTALTLNLVYALLLIGLGIGIARTVRTLIIRGLGENRVDINIRTLVGRISYYIVLALTAFWILSILSIPIGIPAAFIGILTVALAVAVQDILKDLVAGFYILIERPFHIGDQISTTDGGVTYTGTIEDVQLRATKLHLVSGEEVIIPNSLIFGNSVVNNTSYSERRATLAVSIPEAEYVKDETVGQILRALKKLESVMVKPEPQATLSSITSKEVVFTVRFWIANKQFSTVAEVMYALHALLPNAELTIKEAAGDV
ncbi:MAG: mechanosensitive ion channel [Ktedonobacteraceae bacterium]|nr:mechanosensitive ion channel [Ktedonobacteraceae bacterium]